VRTVLARLDPLLQPGPIATALAIIALGLVIAGTVGTLATGRWYYRLILLAGAALWPLPDHQLQGPVILPLSYQHGVHLTDLLSVVAVVIAVIPGRRARWGSRSALVDRDRGQPGR